MSDLSRTSLVESVRHFDPRDDLVRSTTDPYTLALLGKWRDRQHLGRLAYEAMMGHPAVSTPFGTLLAFIASSHVEFAPQVPDPTPAQRRYADFMNAQMRRLALAEMPWSKIVNGFVGSALEFGFSLAEFVTELAPFEGRSRVQASCLAVLPQASLDAGWVPRQELGQTIDPSSTPRYTCFDFDARGRVNGYHQYRETRALPAQDTVAWTSPDRRAQILHLKRGGGDGNPYGESILYAAIDPWADLHLQERQEAAFLDNAAPFLTGTYKSDTPNPNFTKDVKKAVEEADPRFRVLTGNNAEFGSVSATNPDYRDHVKERVNRLQTYIANAIMVPRGVYGDVSADDDLDTRNTIQIFIKHTLPAIQREISDCLTYQFGRRLLDANWSLNPEDYPVLTFHASTTNDARLVAGVLGVLMPHIDRERLGEAAAGLLPGFRREWIGDPAKSVAVVTAETLPDLAGAPDGDGEIEVRSYRRQRHGRSAPSTFTNPTGGPGKSAGAERERTDGETDGLATGTRSEA